jgi:hypothetical protein
MIRTSPCRANEEDDADEDGGEAVTMLVPFTERRGRYRTDIQSALRERRSIPEEHPAGIGKVQRR